MNTLLVADSCGSRQSRLLRVSGHQISKNAFHGPRSKPDLGQIKEAIIGMCHGLGTIVPDLARKIGGKQGLPPFRGR